jgi:hypothetical protein
MMSLVDRSDAEFVCARWEPLAPNDNIHTASTHGERNVNGLWGESGQRVWSVHINQDEWGNGYFITWDYKRRV